MDLEFKVYSALCSMEKFKINGMMADEYDFGTKEDRDIENAEDYCCGDMRFERNPSTQEVLEKYKITEDEYQEICDKLEDGLSFGSCGLCA